MVCRGAPHGCLGVDEEYARLAGPPAGEIRQPPQQRLRRLQPVADVGCQQRLAELLDAHAARLQVDRDGVLHRVAVGESLIETGAHADSTTRSRYSLSIRLFSRAQVTCWPVACCVE